MTVPPNDEPNEEPSEEPNEEPSGILSVLLHDPLDQPPTSLQSWWRLHRSLLDRFERPVDVALAGGLRCDRLGFAFASGYQAAGAALVPSLDPTKTSALCATEAGQPSAAGSPGSAHPRAIASRLRKTGDGSYRLDGEKAFVTFGCDAERLLVVASVGLDSAGRNRLRVVAIEPRQGVRIEPLAPTPFAPEIPHARVRFDAVAVAADELLDGDGYAAYLKPFRTIEDIHVSAAAVGLLMRVARTSGAEPTLHESLLSQALALRALAAAPAGAPETHLALAGTLARSEVLLQEIEPAWERLGPEIQQMWRRDRPLLAVATKARRARTDAAWRRVDSSA